MAAKDVLGRRGEEIAAAFLVRAGYAILDRNWRCPQGEIDVVAFDGAETVFVEVKTRSSLLFGHPLEAITAQKLARLRRLAAAWCEEHADGEQHAYGENGGRRSRIRIDAIGVVAASGVAPVIEHVKRVF